jgi:hypothetical protein
MADQSLLELAKMVRGKTLRILGSVSEEQALWKPAGLRNHILWNAGHVLIEGEFLGIAAAASRPPAFPFDWFDKFNWEADPAKVLEWPTAAHVQAKLVEQMDEFIAAISTLSEDRLSQPAGPDEDKTLRNLIVYGIHHEAGHQGEMYLLKKLQTAEEKNIATDKKIRWAQMKKRQI